MGPMMFDVVKLRAQPFSEYAELLSQIVFQVAHLRRISESIHDLAKYPLSAAVTIWRFDLKYLRSVCTLAPTFPRLAPAGYLLPAASWRQLPGRPRCCKQDFFVQVSGRVAEDAYVYDRSDRYTRHL